MASYESDLSRIKERLAPFYEPQDIEKWLTTPHPLLSNRPAIILIQEGKASLVEKAIECFEGDVYL